MTRLFLILFTIIPAFGLAQKSVDLYMIEGVIHTASSTIPYFTFSETGAFDSSNVILRFNVGDEVTFNVKNETDFTCGFEVKEHETIDRIAMGETKSVTITFSQEGTFLYQDPINDHRALGLGGMVVISNFNGAEYFGVFTEHNEEWVAAIADGGVYNKKTYGPDVFTINGKGFPRTMADSLAMIMGHVGDTIRIHITNAGQMYHFPHFHGYHVKILSASHHSNYEGWMKDSFGIAPEESMILELVPDKPGRFPMHNHNLVTTTFGGNYPGGMMMHMHIHE